MHSSCTDRPMYTGAPMFGFAPPFAGPLMGHHHHAEAHGFCHSCCHPRSHCVCHRRECRREAKELVVNSDDAKTRPVLETGSQATLGLLTKAETISVNTGTHEIGGIERQVGRGQAFVGGGCCVHLSVEYMANDPAKVSMIEIFVEDSEGTKLGWGREEVAGAPYRIKEGVITTKPGAKMTVNVVNATARVRWCEVFSC